MTLLIVHLRSGRSCTGKAWTVVASMISKTAPYGSESHNPQDRNLIFISYSEDVISAAVLDGECTFFKNSAGYLIKKVRL